MKLRYGFTLTALLAAAVLGLAPQASAQTPLVVEWETAPGSDLPVVNALRDAIANDAGRPADRVYVLKRGGFYWITDRIQNSDFPLRIQGETQAAPGQTDFGPAIIQRVARADGSAPDGTMFESLHDLTVKNVWLMGQTDQGVLATYEPIKLLGDNKNYTFDNVVFDRNDWHHLGPDGPNNDFYITNCKFRNIFGPTQIWEGLGVRFEVGADTVVIENNTFFNIGFTPFQSEANPVNYLRFNHNTLVNIGRSFQAGALWKEAYIVNNAFVNFFWHGESEAQYGDPNRVDPFTGFFGIGNLPARFGTNFDRQILLSNNSYWRDSRFDAFDAAQVPPIRPQPFINDTTQGWFDRWGNMVAQNNVNANPGLTTYITDAIFDNMTQHIANLYANPQVIPAARYFWDEGRDEASFVNSNWPLPENFSYSNNQLKTAGTDGLPLGDLNWYPADKATFEANKDAFVRQIEDLTSAPVLQIVTTQEAEDLTIGNGAAVTTVQGFTYYQMDGGGFIRWTFNVPTAGVAELVVKTHLRGNSDRGQRIIINGNPTIRNNSNYGEYFWSASLGDPTNAWFDSRITQAGLIAGADYLNLPAGQNTIRIEPSWGYQHFSSIDVIVGGTTISLTSPEAEAEGLIPHAEDPVGTPVAWAPSGFKSVTVGAGGSVSLNVNAPYNGLYMLRVFYAAAGSAQGQLAVDGAVAVANIPFADTSDVFTDQFTMGSGNHTIAVSSAAGGVSLDYLQVIAFVPTAVLGREELPQGFALLQNYPNPFNPTTNISFTLGKTSEVKLAIYNVLGQKVATLINNRKMAEGLHSVAFDAKSLSSGVYFYRLEAGDFILQKRMLLIK